MSVSKKRVHTKRTTLHFVVRNEQRLKNLHCVVGNKERLSDNKFLNVFAYLLSEILIFLVFVSSGDFTFFSGDITKISGNMTQVSDDMTSGEMTLGRPDRLPSFAIVLHSFVKYTVIHKLEEVIFK